MDLNQLQQFIIYLDRSTYTPLQTLNLYLYTYIKSIKNIFI